MEQAPPNAKQHLSELENQTIAYFCDAVKVLGLPRSVGEIYGLLFVSPKPLSLPDFVEKLEISKGSVSQGLNLLRTLGAVIEAKGEVERRMYFEANLNLKRLVAGFIRGQVRPHLRSGEAKLDNLQMIAEREEDPEARKFFQQRFDKLERWSQRGQMVVPLVQRFLGE